MSRLARCGVILALTFAGALATAQDDKKKSPRRYGLAVDETTYPQQSPNDAMKSIGTALDRKRFDYLLAHMADPAYVDYWVERYKGEIPQGKDEGKRLLAFDKLMRETIQYFQNDPLIVKDLRLFAKEGKWTVAEDGTTAIGAVEAIPARKVFLKKIGDRWFLENRQQ